VALPVDWRGDLVNRQEDVAVRNSLWALRVLDNRARLLRLGDMLEDAALDKYTFVRDAYLQRRRNLVYDGNPPEETEANGLSSDGQPPR
jgi:phospholipid-binding lipoprotein MlaA